MTEQLSVTELEHLIDQTLLRVGYPRVQWDRKMETPVEAEPKWPGDAFEPTSALDLAPFLDHTLLKADATDESIKKLCDEARQWKFASVCVNSCHVAACRQYLNGSDVKVCGVAGFPLGAMSTVAKAEETWSIMRDGGSEVDMVLNAGKLKSAEYQYVITDIGAVVEAAENHPVKVILETGLLSTREIAVASVLAMVAGAAFVKTSTGFGAGGATEEDIALMRRVVGMHHGVKASGGVKNAAMAKAMIRAGANRIGTSNGIAIVTGELAADSY